MAGAFIIHQSNVMEHIRLVQNGTTNCGDICSAIQKRMISGEHVIPALKNLQDKWKRFESLFERLNTIERVLNSGGDTLC